MTMVLVTHEMAFAQAVADQILYVRDGVIWEAGSGDLLKNPQTNELRQFVGNGRSEEHTSELQSLMRISYAVFCLKKKKKQANKDHCSHMYKHKPRNHSIQNSQTQIQSNNLHLHL